MEKNKPKLFDWLHNTIRIKHYSYKTEKSYVNWVRRFMYFHKKGQPLVFLYKHVLKIEQRISCNY